jgi:cytochrome c-type biogenesis protein CcmH/NrfF
MPSNRRSLLAFALVFLVGDVPLLAQQQSDRVKSVGSRFLCMCGCNQVLTQCNHVGCTVSTSMLKELGGWVARGDSDAVITAAFVKEYGTTVSAEPPKSGFSLVAWSMPAVYFLAGAIFVIFVIRKWRRRPASVMQTTPGAIPVSAEALDRARAQAARETDD